MLSSPISELAVGMGAESSEGIEGIGVGGTGAVVGGAGGTAVISAQKVLF